ncbi:sensor histidine kinase [Fulvivirga ligni]|uniref:sensor histidine kinase n=1 Tax=Fulvivirga ligni TaxID=2904246 RepID=UPI001F38C60B|nr:histidine kinase [Fulvivirga ligni]UII20061.1 histidine kinase [Fulvivirga ligni]
MANQVFTKEKVLKEIKEFIIIIALGIVNGFMVCLDCMTDPDKLFDSIIICSLFWILGYKGNFYVSALVDRQFSWLKEPGKRLAFGVLGHTIFTTLAAWFLIYFLEKSLGFTWGNASDTVIYAIFISLLVSLVLHSHKFLISWRQLAIDSEQMKKEAAVSKYESLKNQVNPHFLFNSLNALTNLVYEDQDMAAKFIKKLSQVYRYVLETKDQELVSLETELKFVESYVFLQKIRYEEGLDFSMNIAAKDYKIVPLSVQMLVENAIKHNIISVDEPLHIEIYQEGEMLVVSNNLQKKNIIKEESSKTGLQNIQSRYLFVSDKAVEIVGEGERFTVKLPLLKINA